MIHKYSIETDCAFTLNLGFARIMVKWDFKTSLIWKNHQIIGKLL